ncbi:hypothetical protein LEP1GSC203_2204 [Leptospira terpstrae serovar Hualin str. LT 11-33 = ATCC 700639]|uniref:Uncharacterized protein n=1 Tax=Leptospira terpstrae serovar Hualin str. LT 11-33 = ATCC 700639 TaxID=1257025 RepID=N1W023_9LEPT|nr:hypothetical protein LEP1GSC203_2204 [Leptospira terpstrae serovar Hualin str. LT 11-33 = ATCC 700639]
MDSSTGDCAEKIATSVSIYKVLARNYPNHEISECAENSGFSY